MHCTATKAAGEVYNTVVNRATSVSAKEH